MDEQVHLKLQSEREIWMINKSPPEVKQASIRTWDTHLWVAKIESEYIEGCVFELMKCCLEKVVAKFDELLQTNLFNSSEIFIPAYVQVVLLVGSMWCEIHFEMNVT